MKQETGSLVSQENQELDVILKAMSKSQLQLLEDIYI